MKNSKKTIEHILRLTTSQLLSATHTGCPKKNAILTLEANISGLQASNGKSWTSFENYMFSPFIWAQEQVYYVPASQRKSRFKKLTWTKAEPFFSDTHFSKIHMWFSKNRSKIVKSPSLKVPSPKFAMEVINCNWTNTLHHQFFPFSKTKQNKLNSVILIIL